MGERSTKVAENIIKTYGQDKFILLIDSLCAGRSGEEIAKEFNVTRQRVYQWRKALGTLHVVYYPAPELDHLLTFGMHKTSVV